MRQWAWEAGISSAALGLGAVGLRAFVDGSWLVWSVAWAVCALAVSLWSLSRVPSVREIAVQADLLVDADGLFSTALAVSQRAASGGEAMQRAVVAAAAARAPAVPWPGPMRVPARSIAVALIGLGLWWRSAPVLAIDMGEPGQSVAAGAPDAARLFTPTAAEPAVGVRRALGPGGAAGARGGGSALAPDVVQAELAAIQAAMDNGDAAEAIERARLLAGGMRRGMKSQDQSQQPSAGTAGFKDEVGATTGGSSRDGISAAAVQDAVDAGDATAAADRLDALADALESAPGSGVGDGPMTDAAAPPEDGPGPAEAGDAGGATPAGGGDARESDGEDDDGGSDGSIGDAQQGGGEAEEGGLTAGVLDEAAPGRGGVDGAGGGDRREMDQGPLAVDVAEEWVAARWRAGVGGMEKALEAGERGARSQVDYRDAHANYAAIADAAVRRGALPASRRAFARAYFEAVGPATAAPAEEMTDE